MKKRNKIYLNFEILLGSLGIIVILAIEFREFLIDGIPEGQPDFSPVPIFRSIVLLVSIIAIFSSIIRKNQPRLYLFNDYRIRLERFGIFGTLIASTSILLIFIFRPTVFNALSLEDRLIEWGSAIFLLIGCLIFVWSFLISRSKSYFPRVAKLSLAILSILFFVIAMEEISWFQRILGFAPVKLFEDNYQNEMNLHNFATGTAEIIYYFGSFLFLVLLPFIYLIFPNLTKFNYLRLFIARPFIAVIGTFFCAYNFDMWNISVIQISFYCSVFILLAYIILCEIRAERNIAAGTVIIIVLTQVMMLTGGSKFARIWEVTEYKEFLIAFTLFMYSLDVFTFLKKEWVKDD